MKRRSLTGNVAIVFFIISFICVIIAFVTASWLVSDYRITGAQLDRLGLWMHCFRSLPDPTNAYQRVFFVGCRWVYEPFTKHYDEIRVFLRPDFMIATQFFYTLTFISVLLCGILVLILFLCCGPEEQKFILLIKVINCILLFAGISGCIGVIIFAVYANKDDWMPGHDNNWFGYSFGLAIVGAISCIISGVLFMVEENVQKRKRKKFRESQTRFELEHESKA